MELTPAERPRLAAYLTGGIAQESHSFNPILTDRQRFTIIEGHDAVERNRGANSTFGGVVDSAYEAGVELIVPTLFRAQSGGPVEDAVLTKFATSWSLQQKGDFDAIILSSVAWGEWSPRPLPIQKGY
ncbi:M81 family metallopeptidase [Sinorhizobium fredii]|uniref:M81 family metallopeptidase n=1 Tax=Rhizobium fredii TaxID=380 RepID=UPI001319CF61